MDVKIGVVDSHREILIDSSQTQDEIEKAVRDALAVDEAILSLADRRGRRILVPAARIAYVEIDEGDTRRVGFGSAD